LGGSRGRLISEDDRALAVSLILEAKDNGARLPKACDAMGIHIRTFKRWKNETTIDKRKGASKTIPRKLSEQEEQAIISVCCSKEYCDLTPYEIYVILLDKKIYLASSSSIYRTLRKHNLVHFRGNTRKGVAKNRPPERVATGENQVWAWDITYLKSPVSGIYYYMYTIIDIWSKKIVGWCIDTVESYTVAEKLFTFIMKKYNLTNVYLHSDNGNPMRAGTMLMTLYKLGIVPSFSRPRVSNDNAFIESFFKTLKYMKSYPKYFASIEAANDWVADFIHWYNCVHLHSAIGYVTPEQKHNGEAAKIIEARNEVKRAAYESKKHRWSGKCAELIDVKEVVLNPSLERIEATIAS